MGHLLASLPAGGTGAARRDAHGGSGICLPLAPTSGCVSPSPSPPEDGVQSSAARDRGGISLAHGDVRRDGFTAHSAKNATRRDYRSTLLSFFPLRRRKAVRAAPLLIAP